MSAYQPTSAAVVFTAALMLLTTLLGGAVIRVLRPNRGAVALAWLLALSTTLGVERLCVSQPPGFRMLAIIGVLLWGMKSVVLIEARRSGLPSIPFKTWLGFVTLWPGMQPQPFASPRRGKLDGGALIKQGVQLLLLGAILILLARELWWHFGWLGLATAPLMIGLSLVLHFGIFNISAGLWRWKGVNVRAVFRSPLHSTSLAEFWGKRWNLAFSEMSSIAVYRPLSKRRGDKFALAASFAFSGLLHEMAISLPVRAGFGLPMLYFALHGGLVVVERALVRRGLPVRGVWGRLWTLFWLLIPLPILFHRPFLQGIVWPLLGQR